MRIVSFAAGATKYAAIRLALAYDSKQFAENHRCCPPDGLILNGEKGHQRRTIGKPPGLPPPVCWVQKGCQGHFKQLSDFAGIGSKNWLGVQSSYGRIDFIITGSNVKIGEPAENLYILGRDSQFLVRLSQRRLGKIPVPFLAASTGKCHLAAVRPIIGGSQNQGHMQPAPNAIEQD